MVIDDDESMLRALERTLASQGAMVIGTQWAGDAVETLIGRERHLDLVITDLRMPYVTGITMVYAIRLMFPSIPVVVLTAYGSPELRAECFRQGAAAFLEKSINTSELVAEIERVLGRQERATGDPSGPGVEEAADENIHLDKTHQTHDPL
ncbi:MAG TPA: response regulator transcription factor [Candidatus Sulfopaludibacter sp.]|nr:response regulator transcription factor [Candidatus Sulfopaludibacter sp.]